MNKRHLFEVSLEFVDQQFREYLYRRAGGWNNVNMYGLPNGNTIIEIPEAFSDSVRCLITDWEIPLLDDCSGIITVHGSTWRIDVGR